MLLTNSYPTCFECNSINIKVSNYSKSKYGISGIGFISTNPTGCDTWQCPVCVVLRVCNVSSSALSWCFDIFGLKTQCWTTDIQCLGSTAPTFTKLIPIPACCRSYTYSNASQDITGNICGTLNGCGIADIVNDSVACAYSGLGASLNGESFTSSSGCLTLDDFSFDKVCDACVYCVSCGDIVRRIIEANQISGAGYIQRIGLGLDRYQNAWGYGLLSIGINDAGTCFTDYRFSCSGVISSLKCGTAQCITVLGHATDNVYRCDLPRPGGTTAACKWYVQVCTSSCRNNRSDSFYISLYSMDATLNLNAPVQYYCGSYYGGLCYSKCSYTCSNAECFWLAYTGYYYPVLCSSRCFTILQCTHTAPEGVTFSCFCDIVTSGVSGIQSIDFNGSSFTVSSGAATLEMTPDICYDTATSCMCIILGNQESTKVDLSSLASDHLVAYCGLSTSYDRPLLTGPYGLADGCICKAYYSSGCPITFNACTGLLNVKGIICSQCYFRGPSSTFTSYTWNIPSGTSSRPTVRLMYDITCWAKCTTGQTSKGIVGNIYHIKCSGCGASSINKVIALANYGRNGCPWCCNNTGCIKLAYDYSLGTIIDKPVIVYDSTNDKYWLGLCTNGTSSHSIRFDGFMTSALETSCVLCTDASGCLPSGWSFCSYGTRLLTGSCLLLYCGNTCKCAVDWNSCKICLSANAFNQYAEVDETTYPGVCCTGDVSQAEIADFITMTDVNNCGFMKNFCVYCGSTCKCKISDAGCLKLCANAFNANAQISTSTYPGACCTGTIQGICLNGKDFTTTSGIASLTGFAACDLSTVDNAHTLINGNQCYVFFGCSLSYCCNGTQYALLLRGCAERAGKAMLKCTCENQNYIVPFICKCALGSDCTADFYRSCNDNEPKFNPSTGQLCIGTLCSTCAICTSNYKICENSCGTIVSQNTHYVLLGCIEASKLAVENRIGVSIEQCNSSTSYSNAQINLLWIDSSDFSKNSIEIKNVCTSNTIFRIGGIGFVKVPNTKYACVFAQVIGSSTAIAGCLRTYGQLSNNWTSNVCQVNATPTFDCFVDIPSGKCNFYYNNATMCFEDVDFGSLYNCVCSLYSNTYAVGCNSLLICDYIQPYGNCYDVCFNWKDTIISHVRACVNWQCEKPVISASVLSGNTDCFVPYRVGVRANANNCGCIGIDFASVNASSVFLCAKVGKSDAYGDPTSPDCVWFCYTNCTTYTNTVAINTGLQHGSYLFSDVSANTITANCISTTSSIKCKCDIDKWNGSALSILNNTDIVQYKYKKENANDLYHVGIIAENTNTLISGKNQDQMRLSDSVGLLMKAVQELTPWYKKVYYFFRKLINKWKNRR